MARLRASDSDGARKILEKTLPLPGVLANICDHPCEAACKRGEVGDTLAIGALERSAIRLGRPGPKPLTLPSTGKRAAVVGSYLSSLVCAWDLARKGHHVDYYCPDPAPGGVLLTLPEAVLPKAALERELDRLKAMGVTVRTNQLLDKALLATLRADSNAVFVEYCTPYCLNRRRDVDPVTLRLPEPENDGDTRAAVFCGGWPKQDGNFSPMAHAADGRRAATSMDRAMAGASLTAAREKEGAVPTRLYTSLAGVTPNTRVAPPSPDGVPDAVEAAAEASRCLNCQCLECVKNCAYLAEHKGYPKTYARLIYNNAAIVQGVHQANTFINSCALCGLCEEICPERFSMADLCLEARRDMVARGKMPPSAHDFALEDMAASLSPDFALIRSQPGGADTCAHLFFPGCQLAASHPHHVESAYRFLCSHLSGGVGLALGCCGILALWAGRDDLFDQAKKAFLLSWNALGKPRVVAGCASCLSTFREHLPETEAVFLWEVLAKCEPTDRPENAPASPVALHDPCGLRHVDAARHAVRRVLARQGAVFEEIAPDGPFGECCGYGGLMANANPPLARTMARRLGEKSPLDYATSCAMCRDRLVAEGRRAHHALDFVFPPAGPAPDERGPGFSDRHENRARLKAKLLQELWNETPPQRRAPAITVEFSQELLPLLEDRFLLREDLIQVIAEAERTGRRFAPLGGGRFLASLRPRRVTFWVEYEPKGEGFSALRAWSHRMSVQGPTGQPLEAGKGRVYLPDGEGWTCGCGRPLEPCVAKAEYLGSGFALTLLGCAECGMVLVPEALALGKMAEVERLLEDK